ncbi:MAG: hypothetical protein HKN01_06830, partial [Acidimicrobiia bacterium]|nr:hypothetical protein [Acidimicrobiia bacterium]
SEERLILAYGATEAAAVMTRLDDLVAFLAANPQLGVSLEIINVSDAPVIDGLFDTWDGEPCSYEKANEVAGAITGLILDLEDTLPAGGAIKNVVLVGTDEMIPFFRQVDGSRDANASTLAGAFEPGSAGWGAALSETFLTNDGYGDRDPVPWIGDQLFVPEIAVGRLIETPADIIRSIDTCLDPATGCLLDPGTALSTGYDFLTDVGEAIADVEDEIITPALADRLISEDWTATDFGNAVEAAPAFMSLNAHFSPDVALAADLATTYTVTSFQGSGTDLFNGFVISVGCNAGLNLPDTTYGAGATRVDWSQAFAEQGASVWIGNTSYGIGHKDAIALTELLNLLTVEGIASGLSVGQAQWYAKQVYFSQLGLYSVYDYKAMQEMSLYGLPWMRLGTPSGTIDLPGPPRVTSTASPAFGGVDSTTLTFDVAFDDVVLEDDVDPTDPLDPDNRGTYKSVAATSEVTEAGSGLVTALDEANAPQVTANRPIVPKTTVDVTMPGWTAKGAVLRSLSTFDEPGFDPVVARMMTDLSGNEFEPGLAGNPFPDVFLNVTDYVAPDGSPGQNLAIIPGQFFEAEDGTGVMRTFTGFDV